LNLNKPAEQQRFLAKDFVIVKEGLAFAVVDSALEEGLILCFLRYRRAANGWRKVDTAAANALLAAEYPHYLFYSAQKDARLHGVPVAAVTTHLKPRAVLQKLLRRRPADPVQQDLLVLCNLYRHAGLPLQQVGVTGSLLLGAQKAASDIDLVFYNRDCFHQGRKITQHLVSEGALEPLDEAAWRHSYDRRDCALPIDEYVWHERRKFNKACINGRKFDLSLVTESSHEHQRSYRKLGEVELRVRVKDARHAFDYPATLLLEHPEISSCVSFTATYNGQAESGEWVAVRGHLEETDRGTRRIVIGSSREAHGEYIKVIRNG
jgi:predicted nucleotidyltransferase